MKKKLIFGYASDVIKENEQSYKMVVNAIKKLSRENILDLFHNYTTNIYLCGDIWSENHCDISIRIYLYPYIMFKQSF